MLNKKNRLTKEKEIKKVLEEGNSQRSGKVFFKFLANNIEESRFAFVVSKKISNKAVARNKVKRRMREAARPFLSEMKKSVDGIFIALPGVEKKDFSFIKENIKEVLKRSNLL